MQVKVIVHKAEEAGTGPRCRRCRAASVRATPWRRANVREAIAAWLATEPPVETGAEDDERRKVVELSL